MATPLITFKAGRCEYDPETGATVKPDPTPGYIYITQGEDLHNFCWRPRSAPHTDPTLDLFIVPADATFQRYRPANAKTAIAGRIYVLKFSSSSDRHFFWLQSPTKSSDPSEFSPRDLKIGEIVNLILQGEDVDVAGELRDLPTGGSGGDSGDDDDDDDDDDTAMEDADGPGAGGTLRRAASGGAGAGATGGDVREEGEEAREGGADGGRASLAVDPTQAAINNFLRSLQGTNLSQAGTGRQQQQQADTFTTLPDLLSTTTTIPTLAALSSSKLDTLLSHLPPTILLLSSGLSPAEVQEIDPNDSETLSAISLSLPTEQKRAILTKVLRSPQFHQALGSLTHALRDGGAPMIAEALKVPVKNGGMVPGGNVPLGGGSAVRAFIEGVKDGVQNGTFEKDDEDEEQGGDADVDMQ